VTNPAAVSADTGSGPVARTDRDRKESAVRQMEDARGKKMDRWRDIQAFVAPYGSNVDAHRKTQDNDAIDVLDEWIFYARETLGSFLFTGMTSPARSWRQWVLPDPELAEDQSAKEWTHTLNERAMIILSHSNFYSVMAGVYDEWPTFGTSVVLIEEDDEDIVRYVHLNVGSYALADDAKGRCHAISRRFVMTVEQLLERFGKKDARGNVDLTDTSMFSLRTRKLIDDRKWQAEIEVAHLIAKNPAARANAVRPQDFAYSSDYWEWGSPKHEGLNGFLVREGYREWPAMVFRWRRVPGDAYGADYPGVKSLMAVKSAQQMESDLLMQVELQAKPPLTVPNELVSASILPAARNAVDTRPGMIVGPTHVTHPNSITVTSNVQELNRQRIFAMWHTSLILALIGQEAGEKTATEVRELSTEKLTALGRVVEAATPAFQMGSDREFAIFARRGILPPPPETLQGRSLAIEYTSMLSVAQRALGLNALYDYAVQTANVFKLTGAPEIMRRTDWSQWAQEAGNRAGIPPKVQRSDEQVEELEAADNAAMAKQQQAEQVALEAKAAKDLGQTPMGQDSALDRLVQTGAGL
jgi:hypothetical protein